MAHGTTHQTPARFRPLADAAAWDAAREQSRLAPVVLFKHDPYCGVSSAAHGEVAQLDREVVLVDVANQQPLSLRIARETSVRHESPQVLVLRDGQAVWSASHWAITADAVERALEENA
jgi:bacillithiol system protein YtxJ